MDLYRYMPLELFVDIVINHKLTLLSPDLWEDTFDGWIWKDMMQSTKEKFHKIHQLCEEYYSRIFAQCWSKNGDSIALWNIYSYDKKAIMIHTTVQELEKLGGLFKEITYNDEVSVVQIFLINLFKGKLDPETAIEPLTIKRSGFAYEGEFRMFGFKSTNPDRTKTLDIKISNIHEFIKDVTVHPLAPEWYVEIVKSFCEHFSIPFNGKSNIYDFDNWEGTTK